jgi:hypothetical protein
MRIRLLVALALIAAACSGGSEADTTTSTSTTLATTTTTEATTTTTRPTTTTVDDRPRSPINGLPIDDAEALERRVLAIKIDNHWNARPQSGILEADAVFEIRVEGGLTRFMTVFHSSDSEYLGPIRSGRPSDAALVRPYEAVLVISGGQPWIRAGISGLGVNYIGDVRPGMFRVSERFAPHNLYGNTVELRGVADDRGLADEPPPVPLWEFGEVTEDGEDAAAIRFTFSDTTTTEWVWDGTEYLRHNGGEQSNWVTPEGETEQITSELLIAIVGDQYVASPPSGSSGSSVPATSTIGEGPFFIFTEGRVIEGTWARDDASEPFRLADAEGEELVVPAGKPWISVVPDNGNIEWDATAPTTTSTTGG